MKEAVEIALKAKSKLLIITHFSQRYQKGACFSSEDDGDNSK